MEAKIIAGTIMTLGIIVVTSALIVLVGTAIEAVNTALNKPSQRRR